MKWLAPAFALALAASALFASHVPALFAQQGQERRKGTEKAPGGCFICGNMKGMHTGLFEASDWFGTLSWDACPIKKYSEDHREELERDCQKIKAQLIKAQLKFTSFKDSCPSLAPYCKDDPAPPPEDKKPKCEPPRDLNNNPPWLNREVPCQNRQQATYSWGRNRRNPKLASVSISICGQVIRYVAPLITAGGTGISSYDVCCDSWQNAVSTSSPCDAQRDIDCDRKLNENDIAPFRAAPKKGSPDDIVSNPPLTPTLPFWRQVYEGMPSQSECKDCKWELVDVQYTCKEEVERTGRRSESINAKYKYEATWKCPANGSTTVTNDYATMEGQLQRRGSPCCRCPSPPSGSWP